MACKSKHHQAHGTSKPSTSKSGLITKLEQPQTSRAAQLWFNQDVFSDMDDLDQIEDDGLDTDGDEDEESLEAEDAHMILLLLHLQLPLFRFALSPGTTCSIRLEHVWFAVYHVHGRDPNV